MHLFAIHFDVGNIVLEYRGYIYFRELVFAEYYEKTCFSASTVTHDNQLLPDGCHES